jgi:hypothetical protein
MLRMLDRFAVQQLLRAGLTARAVAREAGISLRSVRRIAREAPITSLDAPSVGVSQRVGRPRVTDDVRALVRELLAAEPELPIGEVWRRVRAAGTPLGLSTMYRVVASVRATIPTEVLVRFEGVAGEFAQFDFGEVSVRLIDGSRRVVHFAAYRLKYSRWVHVVLVPK